mmetsp:Transcript_64009/g.71660  ORF Transcript_64009/g.71660 Transcript_64009/m.71660 type:complete len:221 (+) Transcript_64009:4009-4671(+)
MVVVVGLRALVLEDDDNSLRFGANRNLRSASVCGCCCIFVRRGGTGEDSSDVGDFDRRPDFSSSRFFRCHCSSRFFFSSIWAWSFRSLFSSIGAGVQVILVRLVVMWLLSSSSSRIALSLIISCLTFLLSGMVAGAVADLPPPPKGEFVDDTKPPPPPPPPCCCCCNSSESESKSESSSPSKNSDGTRIAPMVDPRREASNPYSTCANRPSSVKRLISRS